MCKNECGFIPTFKTLGWILHPPLIAYTTSFWTGLPTQTERDTVNHLESYSRQLLDCITFTWVGRKEEDFYFHIPLKGPSYQYFGSVKRLSVLALHPL